jgi:DNA-directed RNA polymerase specialized sigma24 family protein
MRVRRVEPLDPEVVGSRLQRAGGAGGAVDEGAPPDERERIRSALAELPAVQRRALFLAVYLGRTAREISDVEDAPLGTIKTRIRVAMLKLHD